MSNVVFFPALRIEGPRAVVRREWETGEFKSRLKVECDSYRPSDLYINITCGQTAMGAIVPADVRHSIGALALASYFQPHEVSSPLAAANDYGPGQHKLHQLMLAIAAIHDHQG